MPVTALLAEHAEVEPWLNAFKIATGEAVDGLEEHLLPVSDVYTNIIIPYWSSLTADLNRKKRYPFFLYKGDTVCWTD